MAIPHAYYPFRAVKDRPYFEEYLKLPEHAKSSEELAKRASTATFFAFTAREKDRPYAIAGAGNEQWLSCILDEFAKDGKPIFHLDEQLIGEFSVSDLGDATGRDLMLPFAVCYLHFGELGLTFNDGVACLEGAFFAQSADVDGLYITLVGSLAEEPLHWGWRAFESFSFGLAGRFFDLPLDDAIPRSLKELSTRTVQGDPAWAGATPELQRGLHGVWALMPKNQDLLVSNIDVALKAMRIIANALLYISAYPDQVKDDWQPGTPAGFSAKFAKQDSKGREKTLVRAQHQGFTRISKINRVESTTSDGSSVVGGHLRRAHWRRQPYGPDRAMRKLIWVRQSRVLGGTERGRPYLVGETP